MKLFFSAVIVFCFANLQAQEFGGNPSKTKWTQIDTVNFSIVFPKGMDMPAQKIAGLIQSMQASDKSTVGAARRNISIVLQNEQIFSNAYVGLAPWRSEFYTTAPQDPFSLGAFDWNKNLAIHEYRHVQQYSNFNKGFSRFASIILGQEGQAIANAAAVPDWFFEGDAVYQETKYSTQGRGRLPLFMGAFESLYLSEKKYNYQQMRNGSLRFYMPNHYNLGYLLVSYGRQKYGDDLWEKVTADAASFKPFFYPFQHATKKYTGIEFKQFVQDAFDAYQKKWKEDKSDPVQWLTPIEKNNVADYRYPYPSESGNTIVLKKSYRKPPAFYTIHKEGKEQKIANKFISIDDQFSYNNGKIIYASYEPHARWGNKAFNQLAVLDIVTGETEIVAKHSRYFSPDIAHNGKQIVVVENAITTESTLKLINEKSETVKGFKMPGCFFSNPKFSKDDKSLFVIARNEKGEMALLKIQIDSEKFEFLLPFENRLLGYLQVQEDELVFTMTHAERDELWTLNTSNTLAKPSRLASYPTGLYQGYLDKEGKLVVSVFTADGYRLGRMQVMANSSSNSSDNKRNFKPINYSDNLKEETGFSTKKYKKGHQLLNIHSWRPMYTQPEYSFTLYGQNVLNTFQTSLAYTYNENEGSHKASFSGAFGGSYLQPVGGIGQTWSRSAYLNKDTLVNWNEFNANIGLQLPLNLSGQNAYRFLNFYSGYHIDQLKWTGIGQKLLKDQDNYSWQSRISYQMQVQKAIQQIYPHWGQYLLAQYKTSVTSATATQLLLSSSFYIPGLMNNHSIVLTAAIQARDTMNRYIFSNNFPFSRGYQTVDFPRMWKFGFNYHLPLLYPEWGVGNIVYFLRIRANAYYDHTVGKSLRTGTQYQFNTVGGELFFDTKWWNQQPVSFGIRYARLLNQEFRVATQPNIWEFVLPVNLF